MAAWSKVLDCSCYELGHTWTPYCSKATTDVARSVFVEALKIYGTLYLIAAIFRKKKKEYYLKKLLPEVLRSSVFLGVNGGVFIASFCAWRALLGQFFFPTICYLPAACGSYCAIILERKLRRGILALYVTNLAVECLYRMLVFRKIITPIKHGEVMLFSVAMAVYMYLFRRGGVLRDSVKSVLRMLVGPAELPPGEKDENQNKKPTPGRRKSLIEHLPQNVRVVVKGLLHMFRQGPKHQLCRHHHSCHSYVIEGFLRLFGVGYAIQAIVKVVGSLTKVAKKPRVLIDALFNKSNIYLGAFLGSFVGIFKVVNCLLRWLRNQDNPLHGLLAGFLAGWSMMFYKSSQAALYLASKLVEILYFKGIDLGYVPYIKWADTLIYSLSTAFVFHTAVFEPHNLRPAYWTWLLRVTHGKFGLMNRNLLRMYGTEADLLFPDFDPKLDPRFSNL